MPNMHKTNLELEVYYDKFTYNLNLDICFERFL
jgi:hypothetical protein